MSPLLSSSPIGVLDSGMGGLSVLQSLRSLMPHEDFIYCADSGNAPWGDKSQDYIIDRCRKIVDFLIAHHAKAIVLACNTATAMAADTLRREYDLPIIGIEPAVKPAVQLTATGALGVIATRRTIESERYRRLVMRFARHTNVYSRATPGLMECVEAGAFHTPETLALLHTYLDPLLECGIDTLVLGCTHYPFLKEALATVTRGKVTIIEPGKAVAQVTKSRIETLGACNPPTHPGSEIFYVTALSRFESVLLRLWPEARKAPRFDLAI